MLRLMIIITILTLSACAITPRATVTVLPSAQLNPDRFGKSLPVVLHLFQLTEQTRFQQASFQQVWQKPQAVLKQTLLGERLLMVSPGRSEKLALPLQPQTQYLGLIAIFRQPQHCWRAIVPIAPHAWGLGQAITVRLHNNTLRVEQ